MCISVYMSVYLYAYVHVVSMYVCNVWIMYLCMCMYECMYQKVGYVHFQAFNQEETFYINLIYNWGVSVTETQFTIENPNVAQP